MAFLSGDRLTSARLSNIQPVTYFAQCDATLTRTDTTYADISGATITFNTATNNAKVVVDAEFDCAVGTLSTTTDMNGRIVIDGAAEPGLAKHQMDVTDRDSVYTTTLATIATAGSHTIKLQGALSAAAGSGTFQLFTCLRVTVYEVA
jgi:hypothetical protein